MASGWIPTWILRTDEGELRLPGRLFWNRSERRLRASVRVPVALIVFLLLASLGTEWRPALLSGSSVIAQVLNNITRQLPWAVVLLLGAGLLSRVLDRRPLQDLGLKNSRIWRQEFLIGASVGSGVVIGTLLLSLTTGWQSIVSTQSPEDPLLWPVLALGAAVFQLVFVVPEELFARGYLITNIIEGLPKDSVASRTVAAGVAVAASGLLFFFTHAIGRPNASIWFAVMAGGLGATLGVAYLLTGSLAVPIGLHFGLNFTGVITGINSQPASLLVVGTNLPPVVGNSALPAEAAVSRIGLAVLGLVVIAWWVRARDGQIGIPTTLAVPTLTWRRSDDDAEQKVE